MQQKVMQDVIRGKHQQDNPFITFNLIGIAKKVPTLQCQWYMSILQHFAWATNVNLDDNIDLKTWTSCESKDLNDCADFSIS